VGYRDGDSTTWVEYDRPAPARQAPRVVRVWTSTDAQRVVPIELARRLVERFGEPDSGAEHLTDDLDGPVTWIEEECGLALTLTRRPRGEWWAPLPDHIVVELRSLGGEETETALPAMPVLEERRVVPDGYTPVSNGAVVPSSLAAAPETPEPVLVEARRIPSSYVRPRYPEFGPRPYVAATVHLGLQVRADGTVGDIEILDCSVPWEGFEFAAIEAARRWRYEPATRDGVPIDSVVEVELRFR
jgi:TonB family protein